MSRKLGELFKIMSTLDNQYDSLGRVVAIREHVDNLEATIDRLKSNNRQVYHAIRGMYKQELWAALEAEMLKEIEPTQQDNDLNPDLGGC